MIRKVKGGYRPVSRRGKALRKVTSKKAAQRRLRQVEYFKHRGRQGKGRRR